METQHQTGKQPEKTQKSNENEQPFSETVSPLPLQMAIANPNGLTPSVVNALQHTHGNRFVSTLVQRMRATQAAPFLIRRRVPEAGDIDDEAVQTPDAGQNAANVEGLRTLLRRILDDMEDSLRSQFLSRPIDGVPVQQVIDAGDSDQLLALIREMEADPQLQPFVLESTTDTFVTPRESHDFSAVRAVIRELDTQLTAIGTTATHDQHLRDVFGDDPQYGWQPAKARFPRAADELRHALHRSMMGADRTGAADEMAVGGVTETGTRMTLDAEHIDSPDTTLARDTFVHEAFHFAFADVSDEGGYDDQDSFRTISAQMKYTNAEHYTEVYRRSVGRGEVGVRYVPSSDFGGAGAGRTSTQRAYDDALNQLRRAWDAGANTHDFIRDQYNRQHEHHTLDSQIVASMLHHSRLFRLTYHERFTDATTAINQIDLALVEGVVRRLSEAMDALRTLGATLPDDPRGWPLTVDNYLRHGLTAVRQITGSTERDMQMVHYMFVRFDDLPTTQVIPAWFSM